MHQIELRHDGLGRSRVIRGDDPREVERRAGLQRAAWDEAWGRRVKAEQVRRAREERATDLALKEELAADRTAEALEALVALGNLLRDRLGKSHALVWDALKDRKPYPVPEPRPPDKALYPPKPSKENIPPKPTPVEPEYTALEKLLPFQKEKKRRDAAAANRLELEAWKEMVQEFNEKVENYNERVKQIKKLNIEFNDQYQAKLKAWDDGRKRFEAEQRRRNEAVDAAQAAYRERSPAAVVEYCERVLLASLYPDAFPQTFDLDYQAEARSLRLEYRLPSAEQVPCLQSVEYLPQDDRWAEASLPEQALRELYDGLVPRLVLRTLYELFSADEADAVQTIDFQGRVESIDPATGQTVAPCVVALRVSKARFQALKLALVDPKACVAKLASGDDAAG